MSKFVEPSKEVLDLIVKSGDLDRSISNTAMYELARALETPLRQGVLVGDNLSGIYEPYNVAPGASIEFPLDLLAPGEEGEFIAFTNPGNGRIPEAQVEGDYVMIPTYGIANSIDWLLRFARESNWNVIQRAMQIFQAGFVKKINDDGWHTLLSAAADRNILVFDADASAGQFTKRLISLMKNVAIRNGGGNAASLRKSKLTDVWMSPEGIEGMRSWGLDQVDEVTRREIYTAADGTLNRVFSVNLHELYELGENQEYQLFFTNTLGGTLASTDVELVVGLDMSVNDSFLMPMKQPISIFDDPALHRSQRAGVYGWCELGFAVLDNRRVLLGSF